MKRIIYVLISAIALLFVSCSKEVVKDNTPADAPKIGKTITFTASIDLPPATRAALDSLDIKWSDGDSIGVAANNNATIKAYAITVDSDDPRKCTFTIDEVSGATAYYAVYKGSLSDDAPYTNAEKSGDFSAISFNTETKTFSGLSVGKQQVSSGSLSSNNYYEYGYPLSMVGKSSGNSFVMKPCLALVKLRLHPDSLPTEYYYANNYTSTYDIVHNHNYSAIRGFDFYQKGTSTIYSSGDYIVQVADDGSLTTTVVDNGNKKDYRQKTQSGKLSAGTYYMCVIPGGNITSFLINFLGYKDNTPTLSWDAVYTMRKTGNMTVKPGDCYDLGTLNPIGRKKAQNEAADEEEDSFTPVITINGSMTDWDPSSNSLLTNSNFASATGNNKFKELKVAYDKMYIYLYVKRNRDDAIWGSKKAYYYFFFDTDNNHTNGVEKDGSYYDYGFFLYPFAGTAATNETAAIPGFNPTPSTEVASGFTLGGGISTTSAGTYNDTDVEIEIRFLRSSLGIEKNDVINIAGYGNKSADSKPYTKIVDLTIVN